MFKISKNGVFRQAYQNVSANTSRDLSMGTHIFLIVETKRSYLLLWQVRRFASSSTLFIRYFRKHARVSGHPSKVFIVVSSINYFLAGWNWKGCTRAHKRSTWTSQVKRNSHRLQTQSQGGHNYVVVDPEMNQCWANVAQHWLNSVLCKIIILAKLMYDQPIAFEVIIGFIL